VREAKNLSQGDIEKKTGLLRCYISRVENGHTVPAIETLEKLARSMDLQLYQLLYDGDKPPSANTSQNGRSEWGNAGKDARLLNKLRNFLAQMNEKDRQLLLSFAEQIRRR
jgi:transcriptional regulator with XRE-family HTH domain